AFVEVRHEGPLRRVASLRVEEERPRQEPAEEVRIAFIDTGPAGEVRQHNVPIIQRPPDVECPFGLSDHRTDCPRGHEACYAVDGTDDLEIEVVAPALVERQLMEPLKLL